jgi:hypothetical protein
VPKFSRTHINIDYGTDMMINFLKPMVWTHHGPFRDWTIRKFDELFPNAGYMTPKQGVIMLIGVIALSIILIWYSLRHPPSKWERERAKEKRDSLVVPFWIAKELLIFLFWVAKKSVLFVGNKLRRKKR